MQFRSFLLPLHKRIKKMTTLMKLDSDSSVQCRIVFQNNLFSQPPKSALVKIASPLSAFPLSLLL